METDTLFWDSLERRLWAKVDKSAGPDACWPFLGCCGSHGYGHIRLGKRGTRDTTAHRAAYMLKDRVLLPAGVSVCHRCDRPCCCNPAHLFAGTPTDNMQDASAKGRLSRGERSPQAKLTDQQVSAIRRLDARGVARSIIAEVFSIHKEYVGELCRGEYRRRPTAAGEAS